MRAPIPTCAEIDTLLCFAGELWLMQRSHVKLRGMPLPVSGGKLARFVLATQPIHVFSERHARPIARAWESQGEDYRAEYKPYHWILPRWGMDVVILRRDGRKSVLVYCRNSRAVDVLKDFWPAATGGSVGVVKNRDFRAVYATLLERRKLT